MPDFSDMLDALVAAKGSDWVAAQIRESACPGANALDVEAAQFEGDWHLEGRKAVRALIASLYKSEGLTPQTPASVPVLRVNLRPYGRTGLFTDAEIGPVPVVHKCVRMTIPAREALERAGAILESASSLYATADIPLWRVTIVGGGTVPDGIIATTTQVGGLWVRSLRMQDEPPYSEFCAESPDYWTQVDWTPCPKCGAALLWYEAGYAPGYRVCARPPHHHVQA